MSAYKPIESYGMIGDLHSVALVGMDGSIDWCCLPNFDSPSVFAAILDSRRGGCFQLAATHQGTQKQMYLPETNVLLARFLNDEGVAEVVDFMPVFPDGSGRGPQARHQIVRIARAIRGSAPFQLHCRPAFDFARDPHELRFVEGRGVVLEGRRNKGTGAGDGLSGSEGTFSVCTFWLVEALARAGRVGEARFTFEKMLTYANHMGLFAEQIGPSGEAPGNFPQAFTHLGLISAAHNLDRTLDGPRNQWR